jgi:hypothetical protein
MSGKILEGIVEASRKAKKSNQRKAATAAAREADWVERNIPRLPDESPEDYAARVKYEVETRKRAREMAAKAKARIAPAAASTAPAPAPTTTPATPTTPSGRKDPRVGRSDLSDPIGRTEPSVGKGSATAATPTQNIARLYNEKNKFEREVDLSTWDRDDRDKRVITYQRGGDTVYQNKKNPGPVYKDINRAKFPKWTATKSVLGKTGKVLKYPVKAITYPIRHPIKAAAIGATGYLASKLLDKDNQKPTSDPTTAPETPASAPTATPVPLGEPGQGTIEQPYLDPSPDQLKQKLPKAPSNMPDETDTVTGITGKTEPQRAPRKDTTPGIPKPRYNWFAPESQSHIKYLNEFKKSIDYDE